MGSDWDEIKRLAADFQKVQLTSTLQRLSERNCIEIVTLLLEKKLIDVVFTTDGKEYITPEHLEREILDELYVHGGRVNLVELSKVLTIDLSRINDISQKIANENDSIHFMLGQLINDDYVELIAHEINEKLARQGEISISDLTVQFDLPSDFLQQNVEKHLGKIIRGRQDPSNPRIFFTQAYIQKCKGKIRGALAALTRPTSIAAILQQINVPDKIFHTLWEELAAHGTVTSKQANAQYIPLIYSKMQTEWVTSFYKSNGFLEYDAVSKLGISDPKQFIKKLFPNEQMLFLKNCTVGSKIVDLTLLAALNECNSTKSYVDLSTILPSDMSNEDIEELFNTILTTKDISNNFVYLEPIVFSTQYLTDLIKPCNEIATANAKASIENGSYQTFKIERQMTNRSGDQDLESEFKVDKRDERRRRAASGKAGGGAQGRETKTKSTKKHFRGGTDKTKDDDDEDDRPNKKSLQALELIKLNEIEKCIKQQLEEEGLEDLSSQIAKLYHSQLNELALTTAQSLFETTPQTNRRQTHAQLQDRLNIILNDIRLYEKGVKVLPTDVQSQLSKYLLKSLGNDVCNEITAYIATESNLNIKNISNLNVDQRNKIAQDCDAEYRTSLIDLNKSLNKTIEDFLNAAEIALKACSMIIKKVDKKKDRLLIHNHKEKLIEQLKESEDPALILHLVSLILFTKVTGYILHASGRFVSQILSFLQSHLSSEQSTQITQFHDLVLKFLSADNESDEGKQILEQLTSLQKTIRDFTITFEKPGVTKAD